MPSKNIRLAQLRTHAAEPAVPKDTDDRSADAPDSESAVSTGTITRHVITGAPIRPISQKPLRPIDRGPNALMGCRRCGRSMYYSYRCPYCGQEHS